MPPGRVFLIGDDHAELSDLRDRLSRVHPDLRVTVVAGRGPDFLEKAWQSLRADAGPDDVIVLDVNWGRDAPTGGCDLLHRLRLEGCPQPVFLRTAYLRSDGSLTESVASLLPRDLGYSLWSGIEALGPPWPSPLDGAELGKAREAALRVRRRDAAAAGAVLDAIWRLVKPAAYGGNASWEEAVNLARGLPGPGSDEVVAALTDRDLARVREALVAYEEGQEKGGSRCETRLP
ncbi:MAG: hypothetical protein K6U08_03245 [Firmicutes bacterium]|nr:hypothetical protein [Bacillota bacterium]